MSHISMLATLYLTVMASDIGASKVSRYELRNEGIWWPCYEGVNWVYPSWNNNDMKRDGSRIDTRRCGKLDVKVATDIRHDQKCLLWDANRKSQQDWRETDTLTFGPWRPGWGGGIILHGHFMSSILDFVWWNGGPNDTVCTAPIYEVGKLTSVIEEC